jgi:hypothetical protein
VAAEKAAKAAAAPATVTTKASSTAKTVAEGVTVEDVDEAEEEEAGEEMTDNTPETRVKVSYTTCSCVVVLFRMGSSLPRGPPGALGWWSLLGSAL